AASAHSAQAGQGAGLRRGALQDPRCLPVLLPLPRTRLGAASRLVRADRARAEDPFSDLRPDSPSGGRSDPRAAGRSDPAAGERALAMGSGKRTRFRQIFRAHLRQVRGRLLWAAVCTVGVAATELLKPWPLKVIIDHGILQKPLPHLLPFVRDLLPSGQVPLIVVASCAIIVIAVCGGLLSYVQIFITSSIGYTTVYALRRELFAHVQRLSLSFHNQARSGDLLTRIGADTNTLKDVFADSILKFSAQLLTVIGMFAIMFAMNWKIGLIALGTLPFLAFSLLHLYRKTKASAKKQKRQEGQVASRMGEVLSAIPLVQAFAREKHEEERFDAVTGETLRESIRIARLEAAATRLSEIITALGTAAAVLFGALQVVNGKMLPGELVLVVAYLTNMYKPLKSLAKLSTDFSKAMASADRLSEVLDLEPEIQDR